MTSQLPTDKARFDCHGCSQPWFVPPDTHCPRCGPAVFCDVDPRVWQLDRLSSHDIYITGFLRESEVFKWSLHPTGGLTYVVDVANDPGGRVVWRHKDHKVFMGAHGLIWKPHWGMKDLKQGCFDLDVLKSAVQEIGHAVSSGNPVIVHCAAGLRRAPHVVYAYLRTEGYSPEEAWALVKSARPLAYPVPDYFDGIESVMKELRSP